jgi:uncharacterized protein (DUF2147 family)
MPRLMLRSIVAGAIATALLHGSASAGDGKPYGNWSLGNVTVKVTDCGGKLCGTIISLGISVRTAEGPIKLDRLNPDSSRRNRSLIGLPVLMGMRPTEISEWQGTIYNPQDGKTYSATINVVGDTLTVNGCVGGILCKSNKFARR